MAQHQIHVHPVPAWLDAERWLGVGAWTRTDRSASAELSTRDAADLAARLRGLHLNGEPVTFEARPPLPRSAVRQARTDDARRRRDTSVGFSRPGTRIDDEGRWSLTPEALAAELGTLAAQAVGAGGQVLDAGAGAGGNTIGFARAGLRVVAVEVDAERAADLRHNAARYGVDDLVRTVVGDASEAAAHTDADLLFVDPPWGVDWNRPNLDAGDLRPLLKVLAHAERFAHVWLKLPPSFPTGTLPAYAARAVFGAAHGDHQRIKFLLLTRSA